MGLLYLFFLHKGTLNTTEYNYKCRVVPLLVNSASNKTVFKEITGREIKLMEHVERTAQIDQRFIELQL
jgi:hypothetical protein